MGVRASWKAALAAVLAVPVVGITAPVSAAELCTIEEPCFGDLTVNFAHVTDGAFSVDFTVEENSSEVFSGSAYAGDPSETLVGELEELASYTIRVPLPDQLYVDSASCDGASAQVSDAVTLEFNYSSATGEPVNCTITLGDAAQLTIMKSAYYGDGAADFDFQVTGANYDQTVTLEVEGGDPGFDETTLWLPVGTYSVTEAQQVGWLLDESECVKNSLQVVDPASFQLDVGNDVECHFVNVRGAVMQLSKMFSNEADDVLATFEGSWTDEQVMLGHEESATLTLPSGFHSLTELPLEGYEGVITCSVFDSSDEFVDTFYSDGLTVDFTATAGDVVECYATNTPLPVVNIHKVVATDGTEEERTFTFTGQNGDDTEVIGEFGDSGDYSDGSLVGLPNYFAITESSATGGWALDSVECDGNEVLITDDTFFPYLLNGDVVDCVVTNVRALDVQKELVSLVPTDEPGEYLAEWNVTVTNGTDTESSELELTDEIDVPFLATVPESYALDGDGNSAGSWDGVSNLVLSTGFTLGAGQSESWQLFATIQLPSNMPPAYLRCPAHPDLGEGDGLQNTATLRWLPSEEIADRAWVCDDLPAAELTITKEPLGGPQSNGDGTWSQQYTLTVANEGDGYGTFSVTDWPMFGEPFEVLEVSFDFGEFQLFYPDWDGLDPLTVWTNRPIGANSSLQAIVTVEFAAAPLGFLDDDFGRECSFADGTPLEGYGLANSATMYLGEIWLDEEGPAEVTVVACVDGPNENVLIDKMVAGYEYLSDDTIAVEFDIIVTNEPLDDRDVMAGGYQMIDLLELDLGGVAATDFELLSTDGFEFFDGEEGEEPDPDADAARFSTAEALWAIGQVQPGSTHTYRVRVTYSVDLEVGFLGECIDIEESIESDTQAGGAMNVVMWAAGGVNFDFPIEPQSVEQRLDRRMQKVFIAPDDLESFAGLGISYDCVDLSVIEVDKEVDDTNGGSAAPDEFEFIVFNDRKEERVLGHDSPMLIVAGDFLVVEDEAAGYVPSISCSAEPIEYDGDDSEPSSALATAEVARVAGPTAEITIEPSTWVTCDVLNTANSADLAVYKSDGDAVAVAGGAPITYTFDVRNQNGFLEGDATLIDELPEGWSWVPGTVEGCASHTIVGRTLECVIAEEDLMSPYDETSVSADAQVAADAPSGDYENIVVVGSEAKPAPDDPSCVTLKGEEGDSEEENEEIELDPNFACEITPVVREASMSATKTSNATGPVAIGGS
ncbi:MAG TPA: hypothetical protein DCR14_03800, partial [Acidimicrobiaceae bacterium]|nr:hypothetical protein [Acidimicrobiaceae bacterium]